MAGRGSRSPFATRGWRTRGARGMGDAASPPSFTPMGSRSLSRARWWPSVRPSRLWPEPERNWNPSAPRIARPWTRCSPKTAQGVHGLLPALNPGRYPQARSSIQNLMEPVTTFLRWWRQTGEATPLTTSAIESAFSQVSNRIKRVGKRWAEQGLLNWLNVTFSKSFTPGRWAHILGQNLQEVPGIRLISVRASSAWFGAIT